MFDCDFCPARFTRGHDLRRHIRLHTDERPFECATCGKGFSRSDALKRHENVERCAEGGREKKARRPREAINYPNELVASSISTSETVAAAVVSTAVMDMVGEEEEEEEEEDDDEDH